MGYSFRLAAMVLLYEPYNRQDSTYPGLCYTSREALAETRNSSISPPCEIDPMTFHTTSGRSIMELHLAPYQLQNKDNNQLMK